jgi:type IV secretion system protein VirB10
MKKDIKDIKNKKKDVNDDSEELLDEEEFSDENENQDDEDDNDDEEDDIIYDDDEIEDEENNEKKSKAYSNESSSESEPSKFSKIKEIFQDKKKLALIFIILIISGVGIYFLFSGNKNKNPKKENVGSESKQEIEKNPYRINESILGELPEIKIKPPKKQEKQEIINELSKNNDLLSLKLEEELKIPEKKPEKLTELKLEIPNPTIINKEPTTQTPSTPLPLPTQVKPAVNSNQLPLPNLSGLSAQTSNQQQSNIIKDESVQRKIDANVIVFAGSGGSKEDKKENALALINGKKKTKKSSFASISESYVGFKDRMILAGKIIDLVLESAINTEQEGMIRAIVASDVYSESGFNVLIPAGSRVLGKYAPVLKYGNFRVNIMFNRIVRPDGVDIILGDMKAINKLGASGVNADKVDNRIGSAFGNSVLIGALSLATLFASREIEDLSAQNNSKNQVGSSSSTNPTTVVVVVPGGSGSTNGTNNNNKNDSNEYGSATRDIINDAIEPLKQHLEKLQSEKTPVLIINQGRKVSIMTDKDIVFNDENAFVFYPEEANELGIK